MNGTVRLALRYRPAADTLSVEVIGDGDAPHESVVVDADLTVTWVREGDSARISSAQLLHAAARLRSGRDLPYLSGTMRRHLHALIDRDDTGPVSRSGLLARLSRHRETLVDVPLANLAIQPSTIGRAGVRPEVAQAVGRALTAVLGALDRRWTETAHGRREADAALRFLAQELRGAVEQPVPRSAPGTTAAIRERIVGRRALHPSVGARLIAAAEQLDEPADWATATHSLDALASRIVHPAARR